MVLLQAVPVPDDAQNNRGFETTYTTDFARYNGFVQRNPILASIINIRAASCFSSWKTHGGANAAQAAEMLDAWKGRGDDTFKLSMANLYAIAFIAGDAYAEWIFDGKDVIDCEILPADNIRQVVGKNGRISKFEEVNGGATWRTDEIFHLPFKKLGASTHGESQIKGLQNILVDYEQLIQNGSEMYRLLSKPHRFIYVNTDNKAKLTEIKNQLHDAENTFSATTLLPSNLINKIESVSLSMPLKPQEWLETLREEMYIATQTPKIIMGEGYANSEESLATHMAGFRGSIRFDQKWMEEHLRRQLFSQRWPKDPPSIRFSFATEPYEERSNRMLTAAQTLQGFTISPDSRTQLTAEALEEAGLLEE